MPAVLGLDSSILSPFARAGRLDVLERVTAGRRCVVTERVWEEIDRGRDLYSSLADVRAQRWIETVRVDTLDALAVFNHYIRVLGSSDRNIGEASILAWAEVCSGIAVMDDGDAVSAGRSRNVAVVRSLRLLCDALQRDVLTIDEICAVIDDLRGPGGARLPCDGAGFARWAEDHGLIIAR